jgi:hypothetical protein
LGAIAFAIMNCAMSTATERESQQPAGQQR